MASKSEILKYILKFEKETGALKAAGLDVDELTKKTGKDQPEAAGKAAEGYKKWLKEGKEGLHLLRSPMELLHKAMGAFSGVIALGVIAWELFKGKTQEVTAAVEESRNKHLEMIEVYKKAADAGVKLTAVQEGYRDSLDKLSRLEGLQLSEALQKNNTELREKKIALEAAAEAMAKTQKSTTDASMQGEAYTVSSRKLREEIVRLNEKLAANAATLEAIAKGSKDAKGETDRMTKEATAKRQVQAIELTAELAHSKAMSEIEKAALEYKLSNLNLSGEQQKAIRDQQYAIDVAQAKTAYDNRIAVINNEAGKELADQQGRDAEKLGAARELADNLLKLETKLAQDKNKVDQDKLKKTEKYIKEEMTAFRTAFAARLAQTHDLGEALKAGAASVIETAANQAATEIELSGWTAAAKAGAAAASGGPIAVAAAFASTLALYTALAAGVAGVGALAGGAIGGGGGAGGGGGTSGSGGSGSTSDGGTPGTSGPSSGGMVPAGSGGGPGSGTINVALYLDREVILRLIQRASFSGELQISANAISP